MHLVVSFPDFTFLKDCLFFFCIPQCLSLQRPSVNPGLCHCRRSVFFLVACTEPSKELDTCCNR